MFGLKCFSNLNLKKLLDIRPKSFKNVRVGISLFSKVAGCRLATFTKIDFSKNLLELPVTSCGLLEIGRTATYRKYNYRKIYRNALNG